MQRPEQLYSVSEGLIFPSQELDATMRSTRRAYLWTAVATLGLPAALGGPAHAAGTLRPKLEFRETFGDVRTQESVAQQGRLRIQSLVPLTGVSLKKIGPETEFFIGLGNLTMAGTLADNPKYHAGKKSIHLRDRGRDLQMEWNRRRLLVTLTIATERGEPGAFAETYMPAPDGTIEGTALSFISFGEKASRLEISYSGEKTTRDGLRKVRLSGSGDTECGCF